MILLAFALTFIAGISTGLGGCLAFLFSKKKGFLSVVLGFSAGIMIYVSFMELIPEAFHLIEKSYLFVFFIGIALMALLDYIIPQESNPHHHFIEGGKKRLYRVGLFSAVVIALHNFPEGIATFASTIADFNLGFAIAIAIAIHNIPEGLAISAPIYKATGSKKKAFLYSLASGLFEPLGAVLAFMFLPFFNSFVLGIILLLVSGIMVYISFDELLPAARENGKHHYSMIGLFIGMIVMALTSFL